MPLRLQKFLADHGVCSRRKAEALIAEGHVRVNNAVVTELGTKVDPEHDLVAVHKRPINRPQQLVYIALHKPVGVVTSCAQENEVTVRHLVQVPWRVVPAGRLDKDSSGLVLLTNDGTLVHRLTHPRFAHEKEYLVTTARLVTDGELSALARGISLDDGPTQACAVHRVAARRFRIILREGRNRQIRRMCAALHLDVSGLRRTRMATLALRDMPPAHWRHLTHRERDELLALVQTEPAQNAVAQKAPPPRRRAIVRPPYRAPQRDGARTFQRDGARPPERDGVRPFQRDNTRPPQRDGARPPQRDGARPPQRDGARPFQRDNARPPQRDGARPPQRDGARPPQRDGARPPQRDGARPPQRNGDHRQTRPPQHDGARPPEHDGVFTPNRPPERDGAFRPNHPPQRGGRRHTRTAERNNRGSKPPAFRKRAQ